MRRRRSKLGRYAPPPLAQAQHAVEAIRLELCSRVLRLVALAEEPVDRDEMFCELDMMGRAFTEDLLQVVRSWLS